MPVNVAIVLGTILAIAATVILFIMVLPKSKNGKLPNQFLQFLHDAFNFKILFLEVILKAIYVLSTCLCVFVGFFLIFARVDYTFGYGYHMAGYSTFAQGLILLLAGPIVLRISYELLMLAILLVKNVIEINKKIKSADCQEPEELSKPKPVYLFCTHCGTRYDAAQGDCPNCGKANIL